MAKKNKPGKVMVNRHVLLSRLKSRWSFIAWLLAALLAVAIYFHGGQFGGMSGSVFTHMQTAAPLTAGTLDALLVDVGDSVKKGGLLAQMDTSILDAEKALVLAQMRSLSAEVKTEEVQNLRRFDASIIRLQSELRDLRLKQVEASSELEALLPEFERLGKLFESKLVGEQELMPLRMQIHALQSVTKTYPAAIIETEESLVSAMKQKDTISLQSLSAMKLIEEETAEQIRLLDVKIEACSLRARKDCTVSRIYFYPGDIVTEGEPIVASVVSGEPRIIGFLSEYSARDVEVGMKAYLTPVSGHGAVIEARVHAITPEIYTLPQRASPIMGQMSRGRRVVLTTGPDSGLLPGEGVEIHIHRPWTTRVLWGLFGKKSKGEE